MTEKDGEKVDGGIIGGIGEIEASWHLQHLLVSTKAAKLTGAQTGHSLSVLTLCKVCVSYGS